MNLETKEALPGEVGKGLGDAEIQVQDTSWGLLVTLVHMGDRTQICLPPNCPLSTYECIRTTAGSRFHPDTGLWSIPALVADQFRDRLLGRGLQVQVMGAKAANERRLCCGRRR